MSFVALVIVAHFGAPQIFSYSVRAAIWICELTLAWCLPPEGEEFKRIVLIAAIVGTVACLSAFFTAIRLGIGRIIRFNQRTISIASGWKA
jgi:hypothetical protein